MHLYLLKLHLNFFKSIFKEVFIPLHTYAPEHLLQISYFSTISFHEFLLGSKSAGLCPQDWASVSISIFFRGH